MILILCFKESYRLFRDGLGHVTGINTETKVSDTETGNENESRCDRRNEVKVI